MKLNQIYNSLFESVKRDKSRKVLYVDKHGKNIVYDSGDYAISINDESRATYAILWYKEFEYQWKNVGTIRVTISKRRFKGDDDFKTYYNMDEVSIKPTHRNKGFGNALYRTIIDFAKDDIAGLFSYLPNRANTTRVPHIYKKFGAETPEDNTDYQIIRFE